MSNLCNCSDSVLLFIAGERMEHLLKDIGKGHGATSGFFGNTKASILILLG